jgi:hypothetical protein
MTETQAAGWDITSRPRIQRRMIAADHEDRQAERDKKAAEAQQYEEAYNRALALGIANAEARGEYPSPMALATVRLPADDKEKAERTQAAIQHVLDTQRAQYQRELDWGKDTRRRPRAHRRSCTFSSTTRCWPRRPWRGRPSGCGSSTGRGGSARRRGRGRRPRPRRGRRRTITATCASGVPGRMRARSWRCHCPGAGRTWPGTGCLTDDDPGSGHLRRLVRRPARPSRRGHDRP